MAKQKYVNRKQRERTLIGKVEPVIVQLVKRRNFYRFLVHLVVDTVGGAGVYFSIGWAGRVVDIVA